MKNYNTNHLSSIFDSCSNTNCMNHEKYLKVFCENGDVPMENNATKEVLRGFCIGKRNLRVIDSIDGVKKQMW